MIPTPPNFGEPVSPLDHALQTALRAEAAGADDALVVAALLHDVGHLLHGLSETIANQGIDARHEAIGATWLAQRFSAAVVEPVRLHVAAKRYLCAVAASYQRQLSAASRQSLLLQGGPMSCAEVAAFEATPHAPEAVRLREWDDQAKVVGVKTPPLASYRARFVALHASASSFGNSATVPIK